MDKHAEKRDQKEVLINKKRKHEVSEMVQEINTATHECVASLHAVYGEACTLQASKRSTRNRNISNRKARVAATASLDKLCNQSLIMLPAHSRVPKSQTATSKECQGYSRQNLECSGVLPHCTLNRNCILASVIVVAGKLQGVSELQPTNS